MAGAGLNLLMTTPGAMTWNTESAAHLLRRAAFGGTPEEAEELAGLGMDDAVDRLLAPPATEAEPPATDPGEFAKRRKFAQERRQNGEGAKREEAVYQRQQKKLLEDLRYWWMGRMHDPGAAVREKLTLFWHGHFATSQSKVRFNHIMLGQNLTLRRLGMGPFGELCTAMACDPAMLVWLDGRQSRESAPNENFAREIMELFALGEGHYGEEDIREAARAFTGWTVDPSDGSAAFVPRRHDAGVKSILGRTGNFGAAEAVDVICSQPRCADFLSAKIWEYYAGSPPSPELGRSLAAFYLERKLCTRDLLRRIFTHPGFYEESVRGHQVKSPVQWIVQASRELNRQLLPPTLALRLAAGLGQILFEPPSVKGWTGGPAWINSATLIRRSNTARIFTVAAPPLPRGEGDSLDAAAWSAVAPARDRRDAASLTARLRTVFLASAPAPATSQKLQAVLGKAAFPCSDEVVREAAVILLAAPEYQLC